MTRVISSPMTPNGLRVLTLTATAPMMSLIPMMTMTESSTLLISIPRMLCGHQGTMRTAIAPMTNSTATGTGMAWITQLISSPMTPNGLRVLTLMATVRMMSLIPMTTMTALMILMTTTSIMME